MAAVQPALSVLIPAHNGAPWIAQALSRIPVAAADLAWEAIVVDNASGDGTAALASSVPGVQVIVNGENRGFSSAVNLAAGRARGRILAVMNQDLYLKPGALRALADFLSSGAAIAGGGLRSGDGRLQPSCGPFPSLAGTVARLPVPARRRKYYLGALDQDKPSQVDWVTGAFFGFPREVLEGLSGFDEGFFMYYEDVDFCRRARDKGFPVYFLPAAEAVHVAPFAERADAPEWLCKEIRVSQMRYFDKHRPRFEAAAIRGLNRAYFAAKGWDWPPVSRAAAA